MHLTNECFLQPWSSMIPSLHCATPLDPHVEVDFSLRRRSDYNDPYTLKHLNFSLRSELLAFAQDKEVVPQLTESSVM